ncbi:hypothetical protein BDV98DRAFT_607109 [Pterulicium gracile]|uniref:F-box domain-containing protein n=1 Tax=Pterulicium gracile TaxID=1884261 RepID=A0A5C3Q8I7_9AGAR|nr:hypothetical protein BDV98DRAFT_607109 [Pterula gracilis]
MASEILPSDQQHHLSINAYAPVHRTPEEILVFFFKDASLVLGSISSWNLAYSCSHLWANIDLDPNYHSGLTSYVALPLPLRFYRAELQVQRAGSRPLHIVLRVAPDNHTVAEDGGELANDAGVQAFGFPLCSLVPLIRSHVHKCHSLALKGPVPRPRAPYQGMFPTDPASSLDALRHLDINDATWLQLDNFRHLIASNLTSVVATDHVLPSVFSGSWWPNVTYLQLSECTIIADEILDVLRRTTTLRSLALRDVSWRLLEESVTPIPPISLPCLQDVELWFGDFLMGDRGCGYIIRHLHIPSMTELYLYCATCNEDFYAVADCMQQSTDSRGSPLPVHILHVQEVLGGVEMCSGIIALCSLLPHLSNLRTEGGEFGVDDSFDVDDLLKALTWPSRFPRE